jgi:hypothetical protein
VKNDNRKSERRRPVRSQSKIISIAALSMMCLFLVNCPNPTSPPLDATRPPASQSTSSACPDEKLIEVAAQLAKEFKCNPILLYMKNNNLNAAICGGAHLGTINNVGANFLPTVTIKNVPVLTVANGGLHGRDMVFNICGTAIQVDQVTLQKGEYGFVTNNQFQKSGSISPSAGAK